MKLTHSITTLFIAASFSVATGQVSADVLTGKLAKYYIVGQIDATLARKDHCKMKNRLADYYQQIRASSHDGTDADKHRAYENGKTDAEATQYNSDFCLQLTADAGNFSLILVRTPTKQDKRDALMTSAIIANNCDFPDNEGLSARAEDRQALVMSSTNDSIHAYVEKGYEFTDCKAIKKYGAELLDAYPVEPAWREIDDKGWLKLE